MKKGKKKESNFKHNSSRSSKRSSETTKCRKNNKYQIHIETVLEFLPKKKKKQSNSNNFAREQQ